MLVLMPPVVRQYSPSDMPFGRLGKGFSSFPDVFFFFLFFLEHNDLTARVLYWGVGCLFLSRTQNCDRMRSALIILLSG